MILIKVIVPDNVEDADSGVFVCCKAFAALNYYYKTNNHLTLQNLEKHIKEFVNANVISNLRYNMLFLVKEISMIQRNQQKQRNHKKKENKLLLTNDGDLLCEDDIKQSLVNYVQLTHIVKRKKGCHIKVK